MSLAKKLHLIIALSCILLVASAAAGYLGINRLSSTLDFITGPAWDTADGAMEGTIGLQAQVIAVNRIGVPWHDQDQAKQLLTDGQDTETEALGRMRSAGLIDPNLITQLDQKLEVFSSAREQYLSGGSNRSAYIAASLDLMQFIESVEETADATVEGETEKISAIQSTSMNTLFGTLIFGLILFAAVTYYATTRVIRPIQKLTTNLHALAHEVGNGQGDLTIRFDASGRDELSQLAGGLNTLIEQLANVVNRVDHGSSQVNDAADSLAQVSAKTNAGIETQQSDIHHAVSSMEEMTSAAKEVASLAVTAAETSQSADKEAREGLKVLQEAISAINGLALDVEQTASVIHSLDEDSDSIGTVLDVIRGIAEQTNLLALNAAIEAARAGEQGRGFAVVADEVRTLAGRTQKSTEEIQQMIEKLQNGAKQAVQAMSSSSTKSRTGVELTTDAGGALDKIVSAITQLSDMNTQIASAAEEQTAVSDSINSNIHSVADVLDETASGAHETSNKSKELSNLAEELRSIITGFRT